LRLADGYPSRRWANGLGQDADNRYRADSPGISIPMKLEIDVAPGVHRVEDAYTNWYLLAEGGRLTIVDTGVPGSWASLHEVLPRLGRSSADVEAVVLTHAHFDHLGFAERARAELGVPVYVHENDVPLTRHPWRYDHERARSRYFATQIRALPMVSALVRERAFWPSPVASVIRYSDEGVLDVPGSPRIVFTPGHTLGHCALHLPDRNTVIAGDAVVMLDPYTGRRGPRLVAGAATADVERNLGSLDALLQTEALTVLTGHGEPWTEGVAAMVQEARRSGAA
jgi:glyoxylase-like metal-dependent hydrolase (beta-lactamase superfamily II)